MKTKVQFYARVIFQFLKQKFYEIARAIGNFLCWFFKGTYPLATKGIFWILVAWIPLYYTGYAVIWTAIYFEEPFPRYPPLVMFWEATLADQGIMVLFGVVGLAWATAVAWLTLVAGFLVFLIAQAFWGSFSFWIADNWRQAKAIVSKKQKEDRI
jgi:hypothetical protein